MSSGLLSASLQAHEDSQESLTSLPRRDTMGSYLPDSSSYDLLTVIGMEMKTRSRFNVSFILVGCHRPNGSGIPDGHLCLRPRLG